ncbi:MAG: helix-turn-helix domain-containing protein [Bacteroidales bacterium]|nr:helix-turn-helix domain-containing protein [Bacteroidales bacterium]
MTNSVIIQNINVSDLQNIISETLRNEVKNLIPKKESNEKTDIYGTRKEVAKELKLSLPTLTEHTKNGTLKGYRIGGRVLYKWNEVFKSVELIQSLKHKRGVEL